MRLGIANRSYCNQMRIYCMKDDAGVGRKVKEGDVLKGKDYPSVRMDFSGFGFLKREVNDLIHEYSIDEPKNKVHMTAYMILPGIEIFCTDYQTHEHFYGKVNECNYYQIAYSHKGVYESRIDGHRFLRLSEGEISMMTNTYQSFDSYIPMGYFQGINIIFYPQMIAGEAIDFLRLFMIDINELFKTHLLGKRFERFVCDTHIKKVLEALYEASREGDYIHMKIHVLHLLTEFVHYEGARQKKYHVVTDKKTETISRIKNYIEKNMQKHFTIKELAARFHISETGLKDNFKVIYGCSPYEFLKGCRMEWAAQRLKTTDESIADIGNAIGYENPSKFSAAFSSIYGLTPNKYRKNG